MTSTKHWTIAEVDRAIFDLGIEINAITATIETLIERSHAELCYHPCGIPERFRGFSIPELSRRLGTHDRYLKNLRSIQADLLWLDFMECN